MEDLFVGPDKLENLPARSLEIEAPRAWDIELLDAEGKNFLDHRFEVVGLELQVDGLHKVGLVEGRVRPDEAKVDVVKHKVIDTVAGLGGFAAQDIAVEIANLGLLRAGGVGRCVISENNFGHGGISENGWVRGAAVG